jgi:hypothetical protein
MLTPTAGAASRATAKAVIPDHIPKADGHPARVRAAQQGDIMPETAESGRRVVTEDQPGQMPRVNTRVASIARIYDYWLGRCFRKTH